MQQITTNRRNPKVASRTLRPTEFRNPQPKRLRGKLKKKTAAKVFRLSMLDTGNSYEIMPQWANKTLFKVASAHCKDFDVNKELLPRMVSDYMIGCIKEQFGLIGKESIAVDHDKVVVAYSLTYDFYHYDISSVVKLKRTAKPLYIAFCSLIKSLGFQTMEQDACCFYQDHIECQMEYEGGKKKLLKALEKYQKGLAIHSQIETAAVDAQKALDILKAYRGRKKEYMTINTFLQKWLGIRFFFIHAAPYEYYQTGEDHDEMDEVCELPYRFGFYATKGENFEEYMNSDTTFKYENLTQCTPCWTLNEEGTSEQLRDNIKEFEAFCEELNDIFQIITKL